MTERATERVTERQVAVDVLVRVDEGAYANLLLPARLRVSDLDARARAFATDLVYGTLRELRRIAGERRAPLVLLPHLPGLDAGKLDHAVEAAQVPVQAILGALRR